MKLLDWLIRKAIAKERKRQRALGRTLEHDVERYKQNPFHFKNLFLHYRQKRQYVKALACEQAGAVAAIRANLVNDV